MAEPVLVMAAGVVVPEPALLEPLFDELAEPELFEPLLDEEFEPDDEEPFVLDEEPPVELLWLPLELGFLLGAAVEELELELVEFVVSLLFEDVLLPVELLADWFEFVSVAAPVCAWLAPILLASASAAVSIPNL